MNRPITSRMHGMLDYPVGVLLIAAPWIFAFSDAHDAAVAVPIAIGVLVLLQSAITDYELSIANVLPLPVHLTMDVLAGVVLALSPFVFGFSDESANVWVPHVVAGLALVGSGLLTRHHRETPRAARSARRRTA